MQKQLETPKVDADRQGLTIVNEYTDYDTTDHRGRIIKATGSKDTEFTKVLVKTFDPLSRDPKDLITEMNKIAANEVDVISIWGSEDRVK